LSSPGDTDLVFLDMFKADRYQDVSFAEWLGHTPTELVMAHLNIDKATYAAIPKTRDVILPMG
jgi:oxalate decarboxylase